MLDTAQSTYLRPSAIWQDPDANLFSYQDTLVANAAWRRGCRVEQFSATTMIIGHGAAKVGWATKVSDRTSLVAVRIADDKAVSKAFLKKAGLRVPEGAVFSSGQQNKGWEYARSLGLPVVTKPLGGFAGKGVSTRISDEEQFAQGWRAAATGRNKIMVETMVEGSDCRIFVVDGRVVAAARRYPASVIGDGAGTIAALVEQKNQVRKKIPYVGIKDFALTQGMLDYLARSGRTAETVPHAGEHVQLHPIANVSAGGDSEDVSDVVHPDFAEIAVKACNAIPGLFHAGVDLLAEDITAPASNQQWAICEINASPDLALHHFPIIGSARDVAGCLVEALLPQARLGTAPRQSMRLIISGRVQQVNFRAWLRRRAHLHGLDGWVRNLQDGRVEVALGGAEPALEAVAALCHSGPPKAKVEAIERLTVEEPICRGFLIR